MKRETKEHRIIECIPWAEECFVCHNDRSKGIGLRSFVADDKSVIALVQTEPTHEGFPGVIHGGIVSTYLDETIWKATYAAAPELVAMTVEMSVKYLKPVPSNVQVRVVGKVNKIEGRHMYGEGYVLLPDDELAATAEAHFITVKSDNKVMEDEQGRPTHLHEPPSETIWF